MAKLLKLRRGSTSQHSSFTGAEGEVTVDTDKDSLVVHDGSTAGGHPVAAEDMANVSAADIKGRLGTTLTNAEINASAAIAGTKISPDFGSQNITTTGDLNAKDITLTNTQPAINFIDSDNNPDYKVRNSNGGFLVTDTTNSVNRIVINTDGHIDIANNVDFAAGIDVTGSVSVTSNITAVNVTASNDITAKDMVISDTTPSLQFTDTDGNPDFKITCDTGALQFTDSTNSANRLVINSDGHVDVTGNLDVGSGLDVTGAITATGVSTFTGNQITIEGTQPRLYLKDTDHNDDFSIYNNHGQFLIWDETDGVSRFTIASDGATAVAGSLNVGGNISVPNGTVDGVDIAALNSTVSGITSNATHTGEVTGATSLTIANNVVDEANLKVSNSPTNGYFLSAQSGNSGGLTWAQVTTDLVGDTSPQLGGDLDTNSHHILLDDNHFVKFGDGNDFNMHHNGSNNYINSANGNLHLQQSGSDKVIVKGGSLSPANSNIDLGESGLRWQNVYTNDLHLSNEGHTNDIDGTWGNWTIQEGESDLFLKNNRSGKKYKFNLTEVS